MSVVEPTQFLAIIDRLAAQYSILEDAFLTTNQAASQASLVLGSQQAATAELIGSDGLKIVLEAVTPGVAGNSLTIKSTNLGADQEFTSSLWGTEWVLYHATDSGSTTITPMDLLYRQCTENTALTALFRIKSVVYAPPISPALVLLFGASSEEATYGLENFLENSLFQESTPFSGGFAEDSFKVTAVTSGYNGRAISLTLADPITANQTLAVSVTGKAITVTLATNGDGQITSTASEVVNLLNSTAASAALVQASLLNGYGTGVVSAAAKQYLTNGYTGGLANVVLGCTGGVSNVDLVSTMLDATQELDDVMSVTAFAQGSTGWRNVLAGLDAHFVEVNQAGGLPGYLEDNAIKVPLAFASMYETLQGDKLDGAYVFRPDIVRIAKSTIASSALVLSDNSPLGAGSGQYSTSNYAAQALEARLTPSSVRASKTLLTGNAGIAFTAKELGSEGNNVTVAYVVPTVHPGTLSVEAQEFSPATNTRTIVVHLATNSGGTVISTASQVKAAIEANSVAASLVTLALVGTGAGAVSAVSSTALTGGEGPLLTADLNLRVTVRTGPASSDTTTIDQIRFAAGAVPGTTVPLIQKAKVTLNSQFRVVAVQPGVVGNDISIELLNPGAANVPLTVTVVGKKISVILGTNGSSALATTLTTLKAALEYYAGDLIMVDLAVSGSTVAQAVAGTHLAGGVVPIEAYAVTAVAFDSLNLGLGTDGDVVEFRQIVGRTATV